MATSKKVSFVLLLGACVMLSVTAVLAWTIVRRDTEQIIIQTGTLESEVTFLIANDANKDGQLDGGYEPIIENTIYFARITPGETYTFRLIITNIGSIDGTLQVAVRDIFVTDNGLFDALEIRFEDPLTETLVIRDLDDETVMLFSDVLLERDDTLTFDFTVHVKTTVTSALSNEQITLGAFEVRLDQIPPN
ncbi:MAG: hypothetical protein EA374_08020 [Acholeplasmatales bacterium]|nr:MAG: hypothetical protein EA374_08020 [Acholeplasmatales bacterium]